MVQFGKTLNEVVKSDWRCHAVAYMELKHALREGHGADNTPSHLAGECGREGPGAGVDEKCGVSGVNGCVDAAAVNDANDDDDAHSVHTESSYCISNAQKANFFRIYEDSIRRLTSFYENRVDWAVEEREKLGRAVERAVADHDGKKTGEQKMDDQPSSSTSFLILQITNFSGDLGLVLEFLDLNATAFSKIMKKFDKRTGSDLREEKLKELKADHPYLFDGGELKKCKKLCAEWNKQLQKLLEKKDAHPSAKPPVLRRTLTLNHRNSFVSEAGDEEDIPRLVQEDKKDACESVNPQDSTDASKEPDAVEPKKHLGGKVVVHFKEGVDRQRLAPRSIHKTKDHRVLEKMIDTVNEELCLQKAESPFFDATYGQNPPPSFMSSEVETGPVLGEGEFCKIYEVRAINVPESCHICFLHRGFKDPDPGKDIWKQTTHQRIPSTVAISTSGDDPNESSEPANDSLPEAEGDKPKGGTWPPVEHAKHVSAFSFDFDANISDYDELESDHEDDELEHATRGFMKDHCLRNGEARYAVKRIRSALVGEQEIMDAAIDLAREAEFLASLRHPNVIRMRGTVNMPGHPKYGLILDRLYDTLEVRMTKWKTDHKKFNGKFKGLIGKDKMMLNKLWSDRLVAAYDLARGMAYLHSRGILHRDIKPANIGFDVRGDIKIFDFGLAKELKPCDREGQDQYRTSGLAGTRRYMAPEVAKVMPYGLSADVYSFGILMWEMLTLKSAYEKFSREKHYKEVIVEGKRPKLNKSWPFVIQDLLERSWHKVPAERPTFQAVCQLIKFGLPDGYSNASERSDDLLMRSFRSTLGRAGMDTEHSDGRSLSKSDTQHKEESGSPSDSLSQSIRIKTPSGDVQKHHEH